MLIRATASVLRRIGRPITYTKDGTDTETRALERHNLQVVDETGAVVVIRHAVYVPVADVPEPRRNNTIVFTDNNESVTVVRILEHDGQLIGLEIR